MKNYLMMRGNVITGPFTKEELKEIPLRPSDKIGLPGNPVKWVQPAAVEELKELVLPQATVSESKICFGRKGTGKAQPYLNYFWLGNIVDIFKTVRVAAVFMLMIIGTLSIKVIVDGIVDRTYYAGMVAYQPEVASTQKAANRNFKNALVRHYFNPKDSGKKLILKPARPKDVFKSVEVAGIGFPAEETNPTSLLITVKNHSLYLVDNAEIEVLYEIKGEVAGRQVYQFKTLSPLGSQTLSVPVLWDGSKISYKVLNIYTSQYTALTKDI